MNLFKHTLKTHTQQHWISITSLVQEDINKTQIKSGICIIFNPHTTAGITINENSDPDVCHDMIYGFEKIIPTKDVNYKHYEGNSHSHMKTSVVGSNQTLIIEDGKLLLGIWQDIYFCEFDGPRTRNFYVKIMEG